METALVAQSSSSSSIAASAAPITYAQITDMILAGKELAAPIDEAAGASQRASIQDLRARAVRKLQEFMSEMDAEMNTINKHARISCKETFTPAEMKKHFKDLFLQQATLRLKGYARKSHETGDYIGAEPADSVPFSLNEYLSEPDSDAEEDPDFKDASSDVLDECSDAESEEPSLESAQRVLEATADGKRFKAGVLKVATVSFVIATRNAKEFQLMCQRDKDERGGGFNGIDAKLTLLAVEVGGLDKRFVWHIHSSSSDISKPFKIFHGVVESRGESSPPQIHHTMHTHNWISAIFGVVTGPIPPTQMTAVDESEAVDAVILAPELSSSGRAKLFSHLFNETYPLVQSKRSDEEYDDHEDV